MAQQRITEYYPCTKGGAGLSDHALRAAKHRKSGVADGVLISTPRQAPLTLPSTPPDSCPPALTTPRAPSSRKRVRPADDADAAPVQSKRSARKRLILPGAEQPEAWPATEELASPMSKMPLQPSTPSSLDKESKNLVNCILSPNSQFQSRWQESAKGLTFPMDKDEPMQRVADLQTRLLAMKAKHRRLISPTDTVFNTTDLIRLKRVKELEARIRERKTKETEGRKLKEVEETKKTNLPSEGENREESAVPEKVPAFQRFHTLAQDVPPGLSLPYNYKVLAEMFRSMDTIVALLFNRSETVTFAKVQKGVKDMMRKSFDEKNIGQIKTVYPTAYTFRQENNIPTYKEGMKRSDYQLTIEPQIGDEKTDGQPQLSASCLLERRRTFGSNLVDMVKEHHRVFLESLDPPVYVPDDKITRWHPRFPVDTVPDISSAELPQPPQVDKVSTAQEVLNRARGLMPKMEKALANLALRTGETVHVENKDVGGESAKTNTQGGTSGAQKPSKRAGASGALKGVSQSLLERIRAKEAHKMQAIMTRNPQQEEKISMMQRLPEMSRILRNVFVSEKKPALTMEVACSRVIASYRSSMAQRDMEKHFRLLSELVPHWLGIHLVRNETYLKLDKSMELGLVLETLAKRVKEEEAK